MKIALAGYKKDRDVTRVADDEDNKLLAFLSQKSVVAEPVIWNDPEIRWQEYDLVVIKSTWDYHEHIVAFREWLYSLAKLGVQVLNPVSTLIWNSDKHYLGEIQQSGLPVISSFYLEQHSVADLTTCFAQFKTKKLIVKPCVSGGSKHTYAFTPAEATNISEIVTPLLREEAFVVQPFIDEIETEGELSFVFLGGNYSHCIVKRPKVGDFRVQYYFGGSVQSCQPATPLTEAAAKYVKQYASGCLYARVDGIVVKDRFLLMELELIEPFLFLSTCENGYNNYYNALKALIP